MKKLINKIKKIDKTKRIVILFITISFVFIGGFSIYNGVTGNYQKDSITQVSTSKNKKEKNTKEDKKNKQSSENEANQVTDNDNDLQGENNTIQETETKKSSNEKSNSSSSTSQSTSKSSSNSQSQATTSHSQQNQNQTNSSQTGGTSNNSTNSQQNNNKINVSIQVIGMGNTMMSGTLNMDKGKTVYDALNKIASQNGISVEGTNIYIRGIGDLYEKQHGNLSGWMYSVNGVFPNKSCGYYKLENNDNIIWRYVNYK